MTNFSTMRTLSRLGLAALVSATCAGALTAQYTAFSETFQNGNAQGWTLDTEWQIGAATASPSNPGICTTNGDPGFDADGTPGGGIAGVVIGGNATTAVHPTYYLTSPVIQLSPGATVELLYDRWLNSYFGGYLKHTVQVFDGVGWVTIFQADLATCFADPVWAHTSSNVSPWANPAFRVRFGVAATYPITFVSSSWNVDNVRVATSAPFQTIVNGSFESYNGTFPGVALLSPGTTVLPGWEIVSGNVDLASTAYWPASDGNRSIGLNGSVNGAIRTQTVMGNATDFMLRFRSRLENTSANAIIDIVITFDASSGLGTISKNVVLSSTSYKMFQFPLPTSQSATSTVIATISFASSFGGGGGPFGPLLDQVEIVPVSVESIDNGSFETSTAAPNSVVDAGSDKIPGWSIENGNVDYVVGAWQASNGSASLDLSGSIPGSVMSRVMLRKSTSYLLEFDLAGNPTAPGLNPVQVTAIAPLIGTIEPLHVYSFDSTGHTPSSMGWTKMTYCVTTPDTGPALMFVTLRFLSLDSSAFGPALDNVRLSVVSGLGQANSANASLIVNGVGTVGHAGPWCQLIDDQVGLMMEFGGPAFQPYVLVGSFGLSSHTPLGCIGTLDLGTAPTFGDLFIIYDGTSFPGYLFNTLGPTGSATIWAGTTGVPSGAQFGIQGVILQNAGAPCPYVLTAMHRLVNP